MTDASEKYLLADGTTEPERLQLQALAWEAETEAMLDRIGLKAGGTCLDVGCGAMGILRPLSHRIGPTGSVIGIDLDSRQLAVARMFIQKTELRNVELLQQDVYNTLFPRASFDLVHARFVFAPSGQDEKLLQEMIALTKPGGVVAMQEPDFTCYTCFPPHWAWERLKDAVIAAFKQSGGDLHVGQRTYGMLRRAGLEGVQIRATVLALHDGHPYMRNLIHTAISLYQRILDARLRTKAELDEALHVCEEVIQNPETFVQTFILTQTWGYKPASSIED